MNARRRRVVAFLTNDAGLGDDYQGALRMGVERECIARDFDLLVYAGRTDYSTCDAQRRIFELIHPSRVDGVVIASGCIASYAELDDVLDGLVRRVQIPLCGIGQVAPGMPSVLVDNERGAARLVDHLVEDHGRRHIAYVAGPAGHEESEQRLAGTRSALARHGLELPPQRLTFGNFSLVSGANAARELIERRTRLDAIIAANDDMALGVLDALRAAGIPCPEEIALAGFDDSPSARFSDLPLTTVRQPISRLGAAAVAQLAELWEGRKVPDAVTLDTELVVRNSCGCLPLQAHGTGGRRATPALGRDGEQRDIVRLLSPLVDGDEQRRRWAAALLRALDAERQGSAGALTSALEAIARELSEPQAPLHELQSVITRLRAEAVHGDGSFEDAFHVARVAVGGIAVRRLGELLLRSEFLLEELRLSWERLATSLTLPSLKSGLTTELPRLAIRNALVSLYAPGGRESLVPLVCMRGGAPIDLPERPYPSELLIPDDAFELPERCSLTVFPLTFESEQLGVAVFELPRSLEIYTLLREQIGSAVKTVRLHQEILAKERLHAQAQEEKRVTTERLRSLSLIAGGVAHDLNNVLGPLVALPDAIQDELKGAGARYALPPEILDDLDSIRQAGQRAALTIRDLLALGRPEEAPESTIELNGMLEREARTFACLCERETGIELRIETAQRPLLVRASKPHIIRAISNLILNGIDAIDGSGTITVRADEHTLSEPLDGVERIEPGRYALIEVEDTGAGIPPEHVPRILEPFYTARRHPGRGGTGLGLAIVQRIVKDSMGYVHVESALGQGTKFSLFLPLEPAAEPTRTAPPPRVVGGRERILVVDDEPVQLRTARRILEHLGYGVVTAPSGERAVAIVGDPKQESEFDLVVIDMVMPGDLNGIETLERIRLFRPGQRALMVSGYAPDQMEALTNSRRVGWLAKPYSMTALSAAVRAALGPSSRPPATR